jgi:hypothetical protein
MTPAKESSSIRMGTKDLSQSPASYTGSPVLLPPAPARTPDFNEMTTSTELPSSTPAEEPVEIRYSHSRLLEEVRLAMSADGIKDKASMVVIGKPLLFVNSKPTAKFTDSCPRSRRCW